jgi:hypothetical protein
MAHNRRPLLGRSAVDIQAALCALAIGSLALAACGAPVANSRTEPEENDGSGATDDENEDAGSELEALTVDEFAKRAAEQSCVAFARCLGAGETITLSGNSCVESRSQVLEDTLSDLEPLVEARRVRFDASTALACLPKLAKLDCDRIDPAEELSCPDAIVGTIGLGEACDRDLECEGEAFCALDSACPGTCTQRRGQGADCAQEHECEAALTCVAGRCLLAAGAGQACHQDSPCNLTALCVGANVAQGIDGTCMPLRDALVLGEDQTCSFTSASFCTPGLSCVVSAVGHTGGVVAACEKLSARNAPCSFGFPTPCPEGQYCDGDPRTGNYDGTCRDLPSEGVSCVTISGAPPCARGFTCVSDGQARICKPAARIGESCDTAAECRSQHCASGECSAGLGC